VGWKRLALRQLAATLSPLDNFCSPISPDRHGQAMLAGFDSDNALEFLDSRQYRTR
jgi:hypothetical protein